MMGTKSKVERKRPVAGRIESEYRLYRIIAGQVGATCKAVAFPGMPGMPQVEAVEASSVDEAIALMTQVLETRLAEMRSERREGVPSTTEFRESLAALPSAVRERIRDLQIERLDPLQQSSSLAALALRTKFDAETIVAELRKTAQKLADLLDMKPRTAVAGSDAIHLLAAVDGTDSAGLPILRFHKEFLDALAALPPERPAMMPKRR